MMNRRDLLLNEMNISQWVLVKPQVLKGDGVVRLPDNTRLLVVCDEDFQNSALFADVAHALDCNPQQAAWLSVEQALRLELSQPLLVWLVMDHAQAGQFRAKFAKFPLFYTACWQDLAQSSHKRQLWQQIEPLCAHLEAV